MERSGQKSTGNSWRSWVNAFEPQSSIAHRRSIGWWRAAVEAILHGVYVGFTWGLHGILMHCTWLFVFMVPFCWFVEL